MKTLEDKRKERRKETGEDFTPAELVNEMLDKLPTEIWKDASKTWLDPTAGNGNFLVEVKKRLEAAGHSVEHIFDNMIFGVDLMPDNCEEMIIRLYGDGIVEKLSGKKIPAAYRTDGIKYCFKFNNVLVPNIVCANGLEYDYSFGRKDDGAEDERPDPMDLFGE